MTNEKILFSEQIGDMDNLHERTALFSKLLENSVSEIDARRRAMEYSKVFENYVGLKRAAKAFSSYADNDLLSNQYFDATVAGLSNSFAGFTTIERALDQPKWMLYYLDLIGATDGRKVLPNIGKENRTDIKNRISIAEAATTGSGDTINMNKKILPGTVSIVFKYRGTGTPQADIKVIDDKAGNLIAPAGVLTAGHVDYQTGAVTFTKAVTADWKYVAQAIHHQTDTANVNRFKTEMKEYMMDTYPELLVGEANLVSIAAMQKALGVDPGEIIVSKLSELYTKLINQKIVECIIQFTEGNVHEIDIAHGTTGFSDFRSQLDFFTAELVEVDKLLAKKSAKGVKATAYVCGLEVAAMFKKTKAIGLFVEAESSNVNDTVGFFDGIPVIQHEDLPEKEAYALHKTKDGNLAPIARGIYLPLTNTPSIGNYSNPTQLATGVFYQESTDAIVPELIQKFKLK